MSSIHFNFYDKDIFAQNICFLGSMAYEPAIPTTSRIFLVKSPSRRSFLGRTVYSLLLPHLVLWSSVLSCDCDGLPDFELSLAEDACLGTHVWNPLEVGHGQRQWVPRCPLWRSSLCLAPAMLSWSTTVCLSFPLPCVGTSCHAFPVRWTVILWNCEPWHIFLRLFLPLTW